MWYYMVGHLYTPFGTKNFDWVSRARTNQAKNGPCLRLGSPLEAPVWVKDPRNGP